MLKQSTSVQTWLLERVPDLYFWVIALIALIVALSSLKWFIKMHGKKSAAQLEFKVVKWKKWLLFSSFWLLIGILIAEVIYRTNAYYGVLPFYTSYAWKFNVFTTALMITTIIIWIFKGIVNRMFVNWAIEFTHWRGIRVMAGNKPPKAPKTEAMKQSTVGAQTAPTIEKISEPEAKPQKISKKAAIRQAVAREAAAQQAAATPPKAIAPTKKAAKLKRLIVRSPVTGLIKPLKKVADQVFSKKMMGDGIAIMPIGNQIVSPISGVVESAFPTSHAFGIKGEDGTALLIHIGIDTVKLDGKGFTSPIKQGQKIAAGDLLAEIDLPFFKQEKIKSDVILVVLKESKKHIKFLKKRGRIVQEAPLFVVK